MIYSSAANDIQSYDTCQRYVCVSYIHVFSSKIRFSDLNKFNLYTCSEKAEVYVMMPSLASEAQFIQWQCKKQLLHSADIYVRFCKTTLGVKYLPLLPVWALNKYWIKLYKNVVFTECRSASYFRCENNVCLPMSVKCDGYDQCGDGTDEGQLCGNTLRIFYVHFVVLYEISIKRWWKYFRAVGSLDSWISDLPYHTIPYHTIFV